MRRHVVLAAAVLLAACRQDPPGTCTTFSDCNVGQECSGGVCVALATDHQVGSRCLRDADCVAWAGCDAQVCTLAAGRCSTGADCAGWEECDAAHACATAPGRCASTAECRPWEVCNASFVCENGPGYCAVNGDCAAWQQCSVHACETAPGFCAAETDCQAWQDCGTDHVCAATAGMCDTASDCAGWEVCGIDHVCALAPNGCADDTGCAAWQSCLSFRCATAPGFCAVEADCAAWQDCGVDHVCALTPGMCGTTSDCAAWQTCVDHACSLTPGMCATDAECPAWKTCSPAYTCALRPGACDAHADCPTWQYCGTDHACADMGRTCTSAMDCDDWQDCVSGHCINLPGRCGTSPECDPAWQECDGAHVCVAAPGHCATSAGCAAWENCTADHSCGPARPCGSPSDCAAGETCSGGFCTAAVPVGDDDVLLFGALRNVVGWDCLGPLKSPSHLSVGFSRPEKHWTARTAYLETTGSMVYVEFVDAYHLEFRRFVPDSFEWVGAWQPPSNPLANDPVIPTPACERGPWPYDWMMQQGTDAIIYQCDPVSGYLDNKYYDLDGNPKVSGYQLWSWRSDGLMLGTAGDYVYVIDAAGNATRLGTPTLSNWDMITVRAYADGFRFVIEEYPDGQNQRWFVDATGTATLEGVFPAPPAGVWRDDFALLDSTGAAYAFGSHSWPSGPSTEVVIRCPLAPDVCTIVYDGVYAPTLDMTVTPPHVWNDALGASLVAKP